MRAGEHVTQAARWLGAGLGIAVGAYAAYVGVTWYRYGAPRTPPPEASDHLLDQFMPTYDVVDRHHIRVAAPPAVTLAAARGVDLFDAPMVRAIFRGRELMLGGSRSARQRPRGLLSEVQSLGWVVLAEIPGREIVVGAVTRPWEARVTFRSIPADQFAAFAEPDYVKIVWTLRADPLDEKDSRFRTETRAVATDNHARVKFRRYWSFLSPGIIAIRWSMLRAVKAAAHSAPTPAHPGT